jgi:hypothetical protein
MWGYDIRFDREGVFSNQTYWTFPFFLGEVHVSNMLLLGCCLASILFGEGYFILEICSIFGRTARFEFV